MKSTDIVGWAHPDGYALCDMHGNDDGILSPIFADSEWDSFPSCDECVCAITDVNLTSDGINYYLAMGESGKQMLRDAYIYFDDPDDDETEESEQ